MAHMEITEQAAEYIATLAQNANREKMQIADALTTAVETMQGNIEQSEYMNICSVLGRYNRLISLITDK